MNLVRIFADEGTSAKVEIQAGILQLGYDRKNHHLLVYGHRHALEQPHGRVGGIPEATTGDAGSEQGKIQTIGPV